MVRTSTWSYWTKNGNGDPSAVTWLKRALDPGGHDRDGLPLPCSWTLWTWIQDILLVLGKGKRVMISLEMGFPCSALASSRIFCARARPSGPSFFPCSDTRSFSFVSNLSAIVEDGLPIITMEWESMKYLQKKSVVAFKSDWNRRAFWASQTIVGSSIDAAQHTDWFHPWQP